MVVVGPIFLGLSCIDGDTSHVGIWTSARLINYLFFCNCTILGGVDAGNNIPTHDLQNDDRQSQERGHDGRRCVGRYFAVYAWTIAVVYHFTSSGSRHPGVRLPIAMPLVSGFISL